MYINAAGPDIQGAFKITQSISLEAGELLSHFLSVFFNLRSALDQSSFVSMNVQGDTGSRGPPGVPGSGASTGNIGEKGPKGDKGQEGLLASTLRRPPLTCHPEPW